MCAQWHVSVGQEGYCIQTVISVVEVWTAKILGTVPESQAQGSLGNCGTGEDRLEGSGSYWNVQAWCTSPSLLQGWALLVKPALSPSSSCPSSATKYPLPALSSEALHIPLLFVGL